MFDNGLAWSSGAMLNYNGNNSEMSCFLVNENKIISESYCHKKLKVTICTRKKEKLIQKLVYCLFK